MNSVELEAEMRYRHEQLKKSSGSGRRTFAAGKISKGVVVYFFALIRALS